RSPAARPLTCASLSAELKSDAEKATTREPAPAEGPAIAVAGRPARAADADRGRGFTQRH
ncbi:hypothetical protein, partial [Amycolatopsis thailandensis]|uniref:hypothetical protein n=1 Tax=Amycolatopsis thailandensis TaxID=589330 RepID=UPI00363DD4AE